MLSRDDLFELAAQTIGSADLQRQADADSARIAKHGGKPSHEVAATIKRVAKPWLPAGKSSANTREAREAEAALKARNFDLEDAVAAAGGVRGSLNS